MWPYWAHTAARLSRTRLSYRLRFSRADSSPLAATKKVSKRMHRLEKWGGKSSSAPAPRSSMGVRASARAVLVTWYSRCQHRSFCLHLTHTRSAARSKMRAASPSLGTAGA